MVTPSLRLAFIKGPRDGDTLVYTPGSTIKIGRIVRGNEFAIKDAEISTKHLRITSVSGNWAIQDLGSSNGTLLNSSSLKPDTPVDLRDGDVIKLGDYISIVVSFVIDDVQEQKLPPRSRRSNRRQGNPDPDPVGSVQVKPARKRTRASESSNLGDIFEEDKGFDVENVNKSSSKVRKVRKFENSEKLGITRNVESIKSLCVNSIKVEEDATMAEENSDKGAKKRVSSKATRSKNIEIVEKSCLGLVNVEKEETLKEKRITKATRSKTSEIVGDSYLELEMVLNRARKGCGKNNKAEQKPLKSFDDDEDTDPVEEDMKNEVGTVVEVDLGKMKLGELFGFLEVYLPKQINHETESTIEPMRSKTQRLRAYIAELRKI